MLNRIILDKIIYISIDNNTIAERYITIIFGLPFYCSSGLNSSAANTWFPFHGISDKEIEIYDDLTLPIGWFIKDIREEVNCFIPKIVQDDIKEACRFKSDDEFALDMIGRFATLPCLLISSVLGGGIWEKPGFKNLKRELMSQYKEFYTDFAEFEFSSSIISVDNKDRNINKIHLVNQWLINHSIDTTIKTVDDLKLKHLKTLEELKLYKLDRNFSI